MKKFLGLLIFVSLLFNACAPSMPGSSRYTPLDAREVRSVTVTAGAEWFIKTSSLARALVSLTTRDEALDDLFTSSSDIQVGTVKTKSVNWLKVVDTRTPTGWEVQLVGQEASRKIVEVGSRGSYYFNDDLSLVFSVKIPTQTPVGDYTVLMLISSIDKPDVTLPTILYIKVTQPKT
jgi:hypothetical protein